MNLNPIVILGGPTASGKSYIALQLAEIIDSVIINADSMQIYRDIPIISAQPSDFDLKIANHQLYGILPAHEFFSVSLFVELATKQINLAHQQKKLPIIVGGTGLYLKSLIEGLVVIPEIPQEFRNEIRNLHIKLGQKEFHQLLIQEDSSININENDVIRSIRAYEVIKYTGKSIKKWQQNGNSRNYSENQFKQILLFPEREELYKNCDNRFLEMINKGAIEEVRKLSAQLGSNNFPAYKALGVKEIACYLAGNISKEEFINQAQMAIRNYAKRQTTWFRHQLPMAKKLYFNKIEQVAEEIKFLIKSAKIL